MQVNLTQLRSHLYEWIDQLIATGEDIKIKRKGVTVRITLDSKNTAEKKIVQRKKVYAGRADDLVHIDWSNEWSEKNDLS